MERRYALSVKFRCRMRVDDRPPRLGGAGDGRDRRSLPRAGVEPEGYVLPTQAATEVARQALAASKNADVPVATVLAGRTFRTVLGAVRFDAKGDLSESPYRLFRSEGGNFVPVTSP